MLRVETAAQPTDEPLVYVEVIEDPDAAVWFHEYDDAQSHVVTEFGMNRQAQFAVLSKSGVAYDYKAAHGVTPENSHEDSQDNDSEADQGTPYYRGEHRLSTPLVGQELIGAWVLGSLAAGLGGSGLGYWAYQTYTSTH